MTAETSFIESSFHDGLALSSITLLRHGSPSTSSPFPPPLLVPPPRFIDGVFNVRDFGNHSVMASASTSSSVRTRPGLILRSSHLEHVTDEGIRQLHALQVSRIFDLRGTEETRQYKSIVQNSKETVSGGGPDAASLLPPCSVMPFEKVDDELLLRLDKYAHAVEGSDAESVAAQYLALATSKSGILAFQSILRHLLAHPRQTILIHCTLGRDRTGIVFALLLSLAGVQDDAIAAEYALSEQGLEAARAKMVSTIAKLRPDLTPGRVAHKVDAIRRCDPRVMLRFLQLLRERCGGAAGYARDLCRLSESEMVLVRTVLTVRS
ncbi:hypothetical protein E4U55_000650 [Claviceps digitariae]|nr:hypothetical protein E4U55_000650 [Claviceps digitariae]